MGALKTFFMSLIQVIAFILRPAYMVALFKIFAILGILIFLYAYYHAFRSYQAIHQTYVVGEQQSKECGYEYLEKESGIHRLYEALLDPNNPLQERFKKSMSNIILVIALFTVSILAITLYYLVNDPDKSSSFRYEFSNPSWIRIAKVGIYVRYILLRAVVGVGLLVYFYSQQSIFIPDFKKELTEKTKEAEESGIADPKITRENIKELDRSVKATISRQWLLLTAMALTIFIMKKVYVPDIPISPYMLTLVEVILILGILILTTMTKFYSELQMILEGTYVKSIQNLNESIFNLLQVPVFKDYYIRNATRQEKYSDEPFQENQLSRITNEGKLYLYMEHHATRNDELEFMTTVERGKSRSNKVITWSPVVFGVREHLNHLRQADAKVGALFRESNFKMMAFFFIPILLLLYVIFHASYKTNPYVTLVFVASILGLLFLTVMLLNMSSLVRPKDPPPEAS
jgi:Flp pilus assembly protein TadB